ncbi:hypothetical protein G7Z17_g1036 [Cylindrodendrum hubeiense]|uniref:Homeobox domain-containing protein n=1 Tax=Cylindrodendrum hubeiense TaxID=595255 RepID=A0A9P5HLL3_9HYPO|nr:hypothetical protein G7Z17_g1036 [Cylindrodendrum hubeiense]
MTEPDANAHVAGEATAAPSSIETPLADFMLGSLSLDMTFDEHVDPIGPQPVPHAWEYPNFTDFELVLSNAAVNDNLSGSSLPPEFIDLTETAPAPVHISESSGSEFSVKKRRTRMPPKIGSRFSKEAVSILRLWLARNDQDPYPNEDEKEILQIQTGLSKTQIENWLANSRRRNRRQRTQYAGPSSLQSSTSAFETPPRPSTPAIRRKKSNATPLQRWYDSPPEDEPATATDITMALASNQSLDGGNIGEFVSSDTTVHKDGGEICCAFCGVIDPDDLHIQKHNPYSCHERKFSRKDHLKQHLRLVHNTPLVEWLTEKWKTGTSQIRSRCGFCGSTMDTWESRMDHLADHFKMGCSMATWKGDWGFDDDIMNLIDTDRNTPCPFVASRVTAESPTHGYELILSELAWFLHGQGSGNDSTLTNERIQLEACRIIFAAEAIMPDDMADEPSESWLRDLITSRAEIANQAKFGPIRSQFESAMSMPRLNARRSLFGDCPLESQLRRCVEACSSATRGALSDAELQVEACKIVSEMNKDFRSPSLNRISNWLIVLIGSSTNWLSGFRERMDGTIPGLAQTADSVPRSTILDVPPGLQSVTHTQQEGLGVLSQHNHTVAPEIIGSGVDKSHGVQWPQPLTSTLRLGHGSQSVDTNSTGFLNLEPFSNLDLSAMGISLRNPVSTDINPATILERQHELELESNLSSPSPWLTNDQIYVNDIRLHWWLARELRRWVATIMSPNNPNRHRPTDEEIRHQARCILYDDDDPLNVTAADNDEWLKRFKSDSKIPSGPDTE